MYDEVLNNHYVFWGAIPQWFCVIPAGIFFYYDLFFALFIQTWIFVIFNKVYTAQYLLWWLTIMPIVSINNDMVRDKKWLFLACIVFLAGSYASWGYYAHHFEHEMWPTFYMI